MALDVGDKIRLQATFKDIDDVLTDPTTITFRLKQPTGPEITYVFGTNSELVRVSTGVYRVDWPIVQSRKHFYRFEGSGSLVTAEEGDFYVKKSKFAQ